MDWNGSVWCQWRQSYVQDRPNTIIATFVETFHSLAQVLFQFLFRSYESSLVELLFDEEILEAGKYRLQMDYQRFNRILLPKTFQDIT